MKLSIIVPVYGVEKYIEKCISSLLIPNNNDYEIIIVNDGTKDKSIDIIEDTFSDSRIRIIHQDNAGLSAARNRGIQEAKGEYVWCFDSDDWAENEHIINIINMLDSCDVVALSHYYLNYEDVGKEILKGYSVCARNGLELISQVFQPCAPYYIYKREILLKYGLRFKVGILHEDNLFTSTALPYMSKLKFYDSPVYHHRMRNESITHVISPKRISDIIYILDELLKYGKELPLKIRFKWGRCIVSSVNSLLFLTNQIHNSEIETLVNLYVDKNKALIEYLSKSSSFKNRVLGWTSVLMNGKVSKAYKLLYKIRY